MQVGLGTAHLATTPGKCSPDGNFREYAYSRKVVKAIKKELTADGYNVFVDYMEENPIPLIKSKDRRTERQRELDYRCSVVNGYCRRFGKKNVLYVPIHVNAAGMGSKWMPGRGWCAWTTKGQTPGDKLAECLYDAAESNLAGYAKTFSKADWEHNKVHIRTDKRDGDRDLESNYYVLHHTQCAACLTENMFQDNRSDVAWLECDEGFNAIVRLHVEGIKKYIESL